MSNGKNHSNSSPTKSSSELIQQVSRGLKTGRFSLKGIIAMVLFGAIILVFVFFGLAGGHHGMEGVGSAARVNNSLISMADLGSETARLEQMYAPLFGGQIAGDAQRQFLRQQALESLIMQELVSQYATKEGILATDAEVQDTVVREIPAFQQEGRFQRDAYFQLLQANNLTPAQFEEKLRKEKKNMRTRRIFEAAAQPLNLEVAKIQALRDMKMNVAFAEVDKDKVLVNMKAGSVQAELAKPEFAKQVEDYYNNNKAEFSSEEQVKAQHILIKIDDKTSEAQAKVIIEGLQKRAANEDFAKLAKENSQDTGSKDKGGDLGYFARGQMVPEFEQAAFAQANGTVGQPVKSSFGYHLIKVTDKKAASKKALSDVRETIANKLLATALYEQENKNLETALINKDSGAVDGILKKMGVAWQETGFFDMSADAVPKLESPELSKAAFALSEKAPLYPALVRDGAKKFVLRFKEAKTVPASAGGEVALNLARERAGDMFGAWVEDVKKSSRIDRNVQATQ